MSSFFPRDRKRRFGWDYLFWRRETGTHFLITCRDKSMKINTRCLTAFLTPHAPISRNFPSRKLNFTWRAPRLLRASSIQYVNCPWALKRYNQAIIVTRQKRSHRGATDTHRAQRAISRNALWIYRKDQRPYIMETMHSYTLPM